MFCYDHIIVGRGISALGVIESLLENSDKKSMILVIDSEDVIEEKASFSNQISVVGKRGAGGSSSDWHGVISFLSDFSDPEYKYWFLKLFEKKYRHNGSEIINGNNSFIPFIPLRPLKAINNLIKNDLVDFENTWLLDFQKTQDFLIVNTSKKSFYCKRLWLCSGFPSTIDLLSKHVNIPMGKVSCDEHLVGYFGQINKSGLHEKYYPKISYTYTGHFKNFHKISLTKNKRLYVNLRPAVFEFKDLDFAAKRRNFFGQKSSKIISKLFSSKNLGLIFEAIYNKFGIGFNSRKFNLTGHLELSSCVNFQDHRSFSMKYNISKVSLSQEDRKIICEYFDANVFFPQEILLAPGIHFLNPNIEFPDYISTFHDRLTDNTKVFILGGAGLKIKSPEHPTFSFYVTSYLMVLKYLNRSKTKSC